MTPAPWRRLRIAFLVLAFGGCSTGPKPDTATDPGPDSDSDSGATEDSDTAPDSGDTACVPAEEVCDGVDNDCDGDVDEAVMVTWYDDLDGDGYGTGAAQSGCEAPEGSAAAAEDCDDANAAVNPEAKEHCADGMDDDCDGETDETCSGCTTTVPGTSPTVQDAILAAADGAVICVAAGTYFENIDFGGRDVTLLGVEGPEHTTLDGEDGWDLLLPVVTFQTGETAGAVLEGFTIRGGATDGQGGGVRILEASPTLRDLVISENYAGDYAEEGGGGGIYARGGAPTITSVRVEDNAAAGGTEGDYYGLGGGIMLDAAPAVLENVTVSENLAGDGGGIYLRDSDAVLRHVRVSANHAAQSGGCGIAVEGGTPTFDYLLVDGNFDGSFWRDPGGAGIWVSAGAPSFAHVVVRDNTTDGTGGALWVSGGAVTLSGSILAGNDGGDADEVYVTGDGSVTASWTDAWSKNSEPWVGMDDPTGTDANASVDPAWYDDLGHLDAASPLLDVGDLVDPDPDGSAADPGIFGGAGADDWDLDGDGYTSWWLPGSYDAATSPGFDCDDEDASVYPGAGC